MVKRNRPAVDDGPAPDVIWLREVTVLFPGPAGGGGIKAFAIDAKDAAGTSASPARDISAIEAAILILRTAGFAALAGACAEAVHMEQSSAEQARQERAGAYGVDNL